MNENYISDYNYVLSSVGNAFFSGLSFEELWSCVVLSDNREELDAAVKAAIYLKKICKKDQLI